MPSVFRGTDNFDTAGGNAVKAWVNFNGTGTVAIRASFNVSSITDNGTGDYTVNFTTALPDENYSSAGSIGDFNTFGTRDGLTFGNRAVGSISCYVGSSSGSAQDREAISVQIFR